MMDITLVNPVFPSNIAIPPYGLLCLASTLEEAGYTLDLRDYQVHDCEDPWDIESFLGFLSGSSPVLGLSTYSFNLPFILRMLRDLKSIEPNKMVILGGIGASGVSKALMKEFPEVDVILRGEGESTLVPLLAALDREGPLDGIRGLTFRSGSKVRETPSQERLTDLDALPHPAYHLIDFNKYSIPNVLYSRGCPFSCTFCDIAPYWGHMNSRKSLDRFLEELRLLSENHGQRRLAIVDDTFVLDRDRVLEFCRALRTEAMDIEWGCYGKVDLMDEEMISEMARAGCRKVYYGIESGNDRVLEEMRKGFSVKEALRVIETTQRYVETVQTSFVWGFPFETLEQFFDTVLTIVYLVNKGVSVKAAILTPFPHSAIYRRYRSILRFSEELSPALHMVGYRSNVETIHLIEANRDVFPAFYHFDAGDITEKSRVMAELNLSTEDMFDAWESSVRTD